MNTEQTNLLPLQSYQYHYSNIDTVRLKILDGCFLSQTTECETEEIPRHFPVSFVLNC